MYTQEKKSMIADLTQQVKEDIEHIHTCTGEERLSNLQMACIGLANIVHANKQDRAGKPYIGHAVRVADRGDTVLTYCAGILHDVLEEGKELGVTEEFLLQDMKLPPVLVNLVGILTRGENESYAEYEARVLSNYLTTKVKIDDGSDNSDISRFDTPSEKDFYHCGRYLRKVFMLKTHPSFQAELPYDYVNELTALSGVEAMEFERCGEFMHFSDSSFTVKYHFHFSSHSPYPYELIIDASDDGVPGKVVARVSTASTEEDYRSNELYTARQMQLVFPNMVEARKYADEVERRLTACPTMKKLYRD